MAPPPPPPQTEQNQQHDIINNKAIQKQYQEEQQQQQLIEDLLWILLSVFVTTTAAAAGSASSSSSAAVTQSVDQESTMIRTNNDETCDGGGLHNNDGTLTSSSSSSSYYYYYYYYYSSGIILIQSLYVLTMSRRKSSPSPSPSSTSPSGLLMSIVMVPTLLVSIDLLAVTTPLPTTSTMTMSSRMHHYLWQVVVLFIPLLISTWTDPFPGLLTITVVLYGVLVLVLSSVFGSDLIIKSNALVVTVIATTILSTMVIRTWFFVSSSSTPVAQSLTYGEQRVVLLMGMLSVIAWSDMMIRLALTNAIETTTFIDGYEQEEEEKVSNFVEKYFGSTNYHDERLLPSSHVLVAWTGFIGCTFSCFITSTGIVHSLTSWPIRLTMNVAGPLLLIDWMLSMCPSTLSTSMSSSASSPPPTLAPLQVLKPFLQEDQLSFIDKFLVSAVPKSIAWIINFLCEPESERDHDVDIGVSNVHSKSHDQTNLSTWSQYARIWGLIYWIVVIGLCSVPTAYILMLRNSTASSWTTSTKSTSTPGDADDAVPSTGSRALSVTVARKWFHFVAILLFVPTTLYMPQLMTLAYAVALCVLMVLETVRMNIPPIQHFYTTFLDGEAKNETTEDTQMEETEKPNTKIIVSHIFLVFGCAAPHWLSNIVSSYHYGDGVDCDTHSRREPLEYLLSLFGIISIGVGDAMGAVIGKRYGQHGWGRNRRTLEGSLAMFLSIIGCGMLVLSWKSVENEGGRFITPRLNDTTALFVTASFTTVMEAFTEQLDNLVLPLAGSTIIMLFLKPY